MPSDVTVLDALAIAMFFAVWIGYGVVFEGRFRPKNSINARMLTLREMWMVRFLERDNRMIDAQLNGHSIRTASFFASTTIIVVAALVGVLGAVERVHTATADLSVMFPDSTRGLLELKLFLLVAILVYAFFKFTWAIRQFSYFSAVMGSAPNFDGSEVDAAFAKRMARIRSQAVWQLNGGLRAYYFALAALGWFVHPLFFMATTVSMAIVLIYRQMFSANARAIREHVDHLM